MCDNNQYSKWHENLFPVKEETSNHINEIFSSSNHQQPSFLYREEHTIIKEGD